MCLPRTQEDLTNNVRRLVRAIDAGVDEIEAHIQANNEEESLHLVLEVVRYLDIIAWR